MSGGLSHISLAHVLFQLQLGCPFPTHRSLRGPSFNCALCNMCYEADLGVLRPWCKPVSTCEEGACDPMTHGQPSTTGGKSWRANARPPISVSTVLGSTVTDSSRSSGNEPAFPTSQTCVGFSSSPFSLCLSPASQLHSPPSSCSDSGFG